MSGVRGRNYPQERVERVLRDLLRSHSQLTKGAEHIEIVDRELMVECQRQGKLLLQDIALGNMRITRWEDEITEDDDEPINGFE